MKHLSILCFALLSFCCSAQEKTTHAIKIYVEDAETGKNIDDAKVTLEGFEIPAIVAKYDTKNRYYYFKNNDRNNYTIIYVDHKNKEPQVIKIKKNPAQINLKLFRKGTTVETETEYIKIWKKDSIDNRQREDSVINTIHKRVSTLDHHKILILLKNSSNLSYSEIRAQIDSLVMPYGLEYVDDLVPKMYFIKFYGLEHCSSPVGENSIICNIDKNKSLKQFFKENTTRISFLGTTICGSEDTITDFFSENDQPYNNQYDWKKNCYILPYRKKSKKVFRIENDPVLNKIIRNTTYLEFGKLKYNEFEIYERNLTSNNQLPEQIKDFDKKLSLEIKELDSKIMNYKFLSKYDNDYSRVLLMDYNIKNLYLDNYNLNEPRYLAAQVNPQFNSSWKHSFILDEELFYPQKQTTDFHNKTYCTLQRYIGYTFLFE